MSQRLIKCLFVRDEFTLQSTKKVQISIVAMEYPSGIPARFCVGLVPAVALSKQLASIGIASITRVIDPTPIASWCNGWKLEKSMFRGVISDFMRDHTTDFFFDESEQVSDNTVELLHQIGQELDSSTDAEVTDVIERIKNSARRHGGESGVKNSLLYMAAHPFSWLDMYHPLIWKRQYSSDELQFVNLIPQSETRFAVVRKFLQQRRPDLSSGLSLVDCYMTGCNPVYYIPYEDKEGKEPLFSDLKTQGYAECHKRYKALKGKSSNHARVLKDFESLMSFIGLKV